MTEYKVISISEFKQNTASIEATLNALANDNWVVVCAIGVVAIIMERIIDEGALLAEEVLRRQLTYSLPGMEGL